MLKARFARLSWGQDSLMSRIAPGFDAKRIKLCLHLIRIGVHPLQISYEKWRAIVGDSDMPESAFEFIPHWTVFFGMGQGKSYDGEPAKPQAFRRDFMAQVGWSPRTHFSARVRGDSMIEAGIRSGWSVVVDTRDVARLIRRGAVYALRRGDDFHVKFLERTHEGLKIISANSANPMFRTPEIVSSDLLEIEQIEILGTVVHVQGLLERLY